MASIIMDILDKLKLPVKRPETSLPKFTGAQNLMQSYSPVCSEYILSEDCQESLYADKVSFFMNISQDLTSKFSSPHCNLSVTENSIRRFHQASNNIRLNHMNDLCRSFLYSRNFHPIKNDFRLFDFNLSTDLKKGLNISQYSNQDPDRNASVILNNKPLSDIVKSEQDSEMKIAQNGIVVSLPLSSNGMNDICTVDSKCFNQELINRKTKELQKRSKKRRRRQKKCREATLNDCERTISDPVLAKKSISSDEVDSIPACLLKSSHVPKSDHSKQSGSFIIDIVPLNDCSGNNLFGSDVSSFVVSLESVSGDDDDWDTYDNCDILSDTAEFEQSGLFASNLLSKSNESFMPSQCDIVTFGHDDELEELKKLTALLNKVNKSWRKATAEVDDTPRLPSKVSFAPEADLVQTVPVEYCERKGEWEMYASERLRFKRKIEDLEKVLSPCLSSIHRAKIFSRLQQSEL
ncbi:uncharacterized protein LOC118185085 [Stegodyphus dumicola]|uniref:uncharacterized protein LOC118185085 n=1 Tax=Stegodyphus dumicola TaxID=202533 RepID=UPI0015AD7AC5|nr:uncharacterized protein LOC118185085 [Stegodyphus dumicola]